MRILRDAENFVSLVITNEKSKRKRKTRRHPLTRINPATGLKEDAVMIETKDSMGNSERHIWWRPRE